MKDLKWEILDSVNLFKDDWTSIRKDKIKVPNGKIIDPYYVLEYPDWVCIVAITENKDIVLIRQYRHGLKKISLEIPGGIVDKNDKSPIATAKRELLEETGYYSDDIIETGKISANPANHSNTAHCFLARNVKKIKKQSLDEYEELTVELHPLKDIIKLIEKGEIVQSLHISCIFFALKKLGMIDL